MGFLPVPTLFFIFVPFYKTYALERIDNEIINKLKQHLTNTELPIVLIPHVNPDGDAMGSVFGLWKVLKNAGKEVKVISPNAYPDYYHWMEGHRYAVVYKQQKDLSEKIIREAGTLICMDFNTPSRLADMELAVQKFGGVKILIDHHPYPEDFTDIMISDPRSSSTAELTYWILKETAWLPYVDQAVASALFAGIMTDTGSFNYNVSDPRTFETVRLLLEYGISQDQIHANIYDNFSADRMRLLGHCLMNRMTVYPEYHAAMIYLTKEDQKNFNFMRGDSEGFVNIPLSIKGVCFSALFTENDGFIKASFRSKGSFPANDFAAKKFNGGGHRNAAGGEFYASMEESIKTFEDMLPDYSELLNQSENP